MPADPLKTKSGIVALRIGLPHSIEEGRENNLANLDYGPAGRHGGDHEQSNITFQEIEPGVGMAFVRHDHPLLERLLEKYPQVEIVKEGPSEVHLCVICDPERTFKGVPQLRAHMKAHARRGELASPPEDLEEVLPDMEGDED